jgi:hypothetical protein
MRKVPESLLEKRLKIRHLRRILPAAPGLDSETARIAIITPTSDSNGTLLWRADLRLGNGTLAREKASSRVISG